MRSSSSMKMEHVLTAPAAGTVTVTAVPGAQVALDEVLATVVDDTADSAVVDDTADTAPANTDR